VLTVAGESECICVPVSVCLFAFGEL